MPLDVKNLTRKDKIMAEEKNEQLTKEALENLTNNKGEN